MILIALLIVATIFYIKCEFGCTLSCSEVMEAGSGAKFSEIDFQSLSSLTPPELQPCLVLLGKDNLKLQQAETLWKVIVKVYGSANDIPETDLRLLGWIVSGIPPSDFYNLTITEVDTIAAFGQYRNLCMNQALYETVTNFWSNKNEDDLSSYDLMALRQIVCAFNASYIQYIHPDAYRDAAPELATLQDCPREVMKELAKLAIDESAFGNPKKWTINKVSAVGCVISGLPNIQIIPAEAIRGVTTEIKKCLPASTIQAMTKEQLDELDFDSVVVMKRVDTHESSRKFLNYKFKENTNYTRTNSSNNGTMIKNNVFSLVPNFSIIILILNLNMLLYFKHLLSFL